MHSIAASPPGVNGAVLDELPPHSVEAEEGVIGCILLNAPESLPRVQQIVYREHFYDRRCRAVFQLMLEMHENGKGIDEVTVRQRLKDENQFDAVGGQEFLDRVQGNVPGASNIDYYVGILHEKFRLRAFAQSTKEASDYLSEHPDKAPVILGNLAKTINTLAGLGASAAMELEKCRVTFDPANPPPPLQAIYSISIGDSDIPICTPGNISAITAQSKGGKTAFINGMIASTMISPVSDYDTLGVKSANPDGKAVLYFDTEQPPDDQWRLIERISRRAGIERPPKWFLPYCLTGLPFHKCRDLVRLAIAEARQKFPGIHSVVLDGVAELVSDVNDPKECNDLVAELHHTSIECDTSIISVIHFNPGTEKSRGHLGSQLERKAETNLVIDKDKTETTSVYSTKQRRAPIPKGHGPRFRFDPAADMHLLTESKASEADAEKRDKYKVEVEELFETKPAMKYSDLFAAMKSELGFSKSTAERRFGVYRQFELIEKSVGGLWVRKD